MPNISAIQLDGPLMAILHFRTGCKTPKLIGGSGRWQGLFFHYIGLGLGKNANREEDGKTNPAFCGRKAYAWLWEKEGPQFQHHDPSGARDGDSLPTEDIPVIIRASFVIYIYTHRTYLIFALQGTSYMYLVFSFGLLRRSGIQVATYINDWVIVSSSDKGSADHTKLLA